VIDSDGTLGVASRPTLYTPQLNWAEEDPAEWWANVGALAPDAIAGIGVTGMLPAIVLLDGEGAVLAAASSRAMPARYSSILRCRNGGDGIPSADRDRLCWSAPS
jgi:sugar (pentulose or hexulose) kinase